RIVLAAADVAFPDFANVLAVITAFRNRAAPPPEFRNARLHAAREVRDLPTAVVVVELARHRPSSPFEQRGDGVPQRGLPPVADMQRPSRIRRDEFDIYGPTIPHSSSSVDRPRGEGSRQRTDALRW